MNIDPAMARYYVDPSLTLYSAAWRVALIRVAPAIYLALRPSLRPLARHHNIALHLIAMENRALLTAPTPRILAVAA